MEVASMGCTASGMEARRDPGISLGGTRTAEGTDELRGACAERLLATAFSKGASGTVVLRAVVRRVDVLEFARGREAILARGAKKELPLAPRRSNATSPRFPLGIPPV